jgi:SulP family sulfate permease
LIEVLRHTQELRRDLPIVLTCRTGRRSVRAAAALQSRGYDNVSILDGGLAAWEAAGLLEAVACGEVSAATSTQGNK